MQWGMYIGVALLSMLSHHIMVSKYEGVTQWGMALMTHLFVMNTLILFISRWALNSTQIFQASLYKVPSFVQFYLVIALLLIVVKLVYVHYVTKHAHVDDKSAEHRGKRFSVWGSVMVSAFLIIFATWFINYFGKLTPEQFLFNLSSPITGSADDANHHIYTSVLLTWVTVGIGAYYIMTQRVTLFNKWRPLRHWLITTKRAALISSIAMVIGIAYTTWQLKLISVVRAYVAESTYIANHYVDPRDVTLTFPQNKKNLIHIYLESMENSYLDRDNGGYMEASLIPEMLTLAKEGTSFSQHDKMGGPYQTYGSSWSVASMINMDNGIPLKIAMNGNDYGKSGFFLPGIYGLGDILDHAGYEQTIMFGADADFGGLTTYFKTHGDYHIWDLKHARKAHYIPQDYNVWWGFEDDKLYNYAKEEITRLSQTGKPFHFVMETADTHFPDGYLSQHAPTPYRSHYANVIRYSSSEAFKFIRWIQSQPFYKDTVIVVTGDHLSMDKKFFEKFDPTYARTILNYFLNSSVTTTRTHHRQFSPLDFFPTILASIGVDIEGDRLGLGTNLFSETPTLIERDTLNVFDMELSKHSNYYNQTFVEEKGYSPYYQ